MDKKLNGFNNGRDTIDGVGGNYESYTIGIDPYQEDKSDYVNNLRTIEIIRNNILLQEAVEVLCNALREDKSEGSYYHSWVCNIAMAFVDEVDRNFTEVKSKTSMGINEVANEAAKNFLNLLISK